MSPISESERNRNERTRMMASDGSETRLWLDRKQKVTIKSELNAVEQLAVRIAQQCAAERRLGEVIPGRTYDPDRLRTIRLALNSAAEALGNIERTSYEVDEKEFGTPPQKSRLRFTEDCEPSMDGLDNFASELGFMANAESYMIGLISSRRRPDPDTLAFMSYSVFAMGNALGQIGG